MSFILNIFLIPIKILILPVYLFIAILAIFSGLAKGIIKLILGFFSLVALSLAIIGFFSGTGLWGPMLVLFLALSLIPILLGIFPLVFRNLASLLGRFLHFWL